jgi:hypothetical protein
MTIPERSPSFQHASNHNEGKTRMIELTSRKEEQYPVPAQRLWDLVADFGALDQWWPPGMLTKFEVQGEGVGTVRSIHTIVGIVLHEKLESIDPEARVLTLSIVGDLPAGMQDYRATGSVREAGDGASTLVWEGRYAVPNADAEAGARQFIEGAYGVMFQGLRDHLAKEA